MKQVRIVFAIISMLLVVVGCSNEESAEPSEDEKQEEVKEVEAEDTEVIESAAIQLSPYAEEIDFSLISPEKEEISANTIVELKGTIGQADNFNENLIWVVITTDEPMKKIEKNDFNYYIPLENGEFSKQMKLHHGEGEYQVSVRVPSNKAGEEDKYYEAASFDVINQDQNVEREVEYTKYGVKNNIQLTSPAFGISDSEAGVHIEGTVPEDHTGEMVLVQVNKENENRQILFPVKDNKFSGDVPLYFGEGIHHIRIQTYNEAEDLYYESASFYADNQTETVFAEMEKYNEYITRGVSLDEPTFHTEAVLDQQAYQVAGEIDPEAPGAADINYVIVTVKHLDENLESGYLIPVENYQFDGTAYFRFGPGDYEVIINVPDLEQHDQSMFYFQGVVKINHQVEGIVDERDLLPSRGIESDHPAIIQKAEELTAGLESEREKAKAIYQFVAEHVAYDVEKAENDIFNIGDSALSTLESGIGICQDYAFLATALLRAIGIKSHYVEGYAGERHAWVEVKVDGEWLEMDPTWGAGYVQDGQFHFHYNEDYFDPDPNFLAETHTREGIMY
ncbi:hypothetical protein CIL05_02775 [Virgibacillus profundi]|uniref:Transglutaminase-like domain-containing protein n=1 Tax=Virgibacillus profundi TaxID=2024555 RepID=A0A2A2IKB4_9BACI|nr:transglutaminase-like domain-containing protein [Virgibacillus profundi]PAV31600.1 hypothetical protein CIL05_02775 [Virgibacillus profundi]PXY55786.1 transglutaminase domain-containing protein [Virgibacillus profundi]